MKGLRELLGPLEGRIRLMAGRAIVRLVDDARQAQALQLDILADETQDGVERFQQYGITSHPHPGAEALVACLGGLRSHIVAFAVEDRRYRLQGLEQGEVALYDDLGNVVKLGRDAISIVAVADLDVTVAGDLTASVAGSADITAADVTVTAEGGVLIEADVVIEGDLQVNGEIDATGNVTGDGVSLKTHTHGGVATGSGSTGAPL